MTFPAEPTTKDLSHLLEKGFPAYNASMSNGNTITNKAPGVTTGTPSEGTEGINGRDVPDLVAEATPASDTGVTVKSAGYTPSALTWKEC